MRHIGRIRVTYELLESVIRLPEGAHIIRTADSDEWDKTFWLTVEGPMYPPVPEGCAIPWVEHTVSR